ncbi:MULTISPECIES: hypothetical protein [unclassified Mesorhizobium]|uniref:hypothetical protein n=1 Tax=unclassified Mesorhizobium TaxID=325217 RepID=UPI0019D46504|nr:MULTISPECIES: hypothetical protein [unclassified Mesorhizobium]MDF3169733.1 hypothetical protein [Mesorhizobium sp. P16.1]
MHFIFLSARGAGPVQQCVDGLLRFGFDPCGSHTTLACSLLLQACYFGCVLFFADVDDL